MTRYVSIGHRLTGWNAVKNRVEQLDLSLTDEQIKKVTTKIKELADIRPQRVAVVDVMVVIKLLDGKLFISGKGFDGKE
ncbi:2170_t:CDS:2 [Entrophospora sp. SA101]|nr:2170_t:CDS:2 [Entrophospora sp. SA101]